MEGQVKSVCRSQNFCSRSSEIQAKVFIFILSLIGNFLNAYKKAVINTIKYMPQVGSILGDYVVKPLFTLT